MIADLADLGRVADRALAGAQHRGDHVLGDRVLGAADLDVTAERAGGLDLPCLFAHLDRVTGVDRNLG